MYSNDVDNDFCYMTGHTSVFRMAPVNGQLCIRCPFVAPSSNHATPTASHSHSH